MAAPTLPTLKLTAGGLTGDLITTGTWISNYLGTRVFPANATGVAHFNIEGADAFPTDFAKMLTTTYSISLAITLLSGDTEVFYLSIVSANGLTEFATEVKIVTKTAAMTATNYTGTFSLTYPGLTAKRAEWDSALFKLRVEHLANMGADGSVWTVSGCQIAGTYEAAPTVALNTPNDAATAVSLTPDLIFTGTDLNTANNTIEYEVQVDTVNTFDSVDNVLLDYCESGQTSEWGFNTSVRGYAQSFISPTYVDGLLKSMSFHIYRSAGSTATIVAKLYSATDSNKPNTLLATSGAKGISEISATLSWVNFEFTGANQVGIAAGVTYVCVIEQSGLNGSTEVMGIRLTSYGSHSGDCSQNNDGVWYGIGYELYFKIYINDRPLLSKISSIPDATFTDLTNGADTHPFASADQIKYAVQAGNTLTANTTYYWRVRAIDPSGSNTWGAWTTARSFTTLAGAAGFKAWNGVLMASVKKINELAIGSVKKVDGVTTT